MTIPQDLSVWYRDGFLELHSGGRVVTINVSHFRETAVFRNGPIPWTTLMLAYIEPAIAELQR